MAETNPDPSTLNFYASHGIVTDPKEHAGLLDSLPRDIPSLRDIVQGLFVHIFWAEEMGLALSEERKEEVQLRAVARQMARLLELDDRPLTEARPLERRLVGNCRDFSTFLCALLRHQGIPARARAGFSTYFRPKHYEDHWVCEHWSKEERRWIRVDPQLDALQRRVLGIRFDPLDMPADPFLTGGQAWQMCRVGRANPDDFGIFDMRGLWFVQGDLVRDFLALNKIEILPWDSWGRMSRSGKTPLAEDLAVLDQIAEVTLAGDEAFERLRSAYEEDSELQMSPGWLP
jgi:hypothetical protein